MAFDKSPLGQTIKHLTERFNQLIDDLLSTTSGKGASQIGIEDNTSRYTSTNVEDGLAEIAGSGRTTETVKGNKDLIGANKTTCDDRKTEFDTHKAGTAKAQHTAGLGAHAADHQPGGTDVVLEKATGTDVNTGTDNTKFTTPKAIEDSRLWRNLRDADKDTTVDVEETADADTIVGKVAGVEALRFHTSGILDLPKQSGCLVTNGVIQVIPSGADTKVVLNGKEYDTQNEFDATTNYRWTTTKVGKYLVTLKVRLETTDGMPWRLSLHKNSAAHVYFFSIPGATTIEHSCGFSIPLHLGAGDYLEMYVYQTTGANKNLYATLYNCHFSVTKLF